MGINASFLYLRIGTQPIEKVHECIASFYSKPPVYRLSPVDRGWVSVYVLEEGDPKADQALGKCLSTTLWCVVALETVSEICNAWGIRSFEPEGREWVQMRYIDEDQHVVHPSIDSKEAFGRLVPDEDFQYREFFLPPDEEEVLRDKSYTHKEDTPIALDPDDILF